MNIESIDIPKKEELPDNNIRAIAETIQPYRWKSEINDEQYASIAFALLNLEGDKDTKMLIANYIQRQHQNLKTTVLQNWTLVKNINEILRFAARAVKEKVGEKIH